MEYYIDVTILPDPEFPSSVLLNSFYSKLHKALYDMGSKNIGVSFPKYSITLGNLIRLHGTNSDLEQLGISKFVGSMISYVQISEIKKVPSNVRHRIISRKQPTLSQAKLRRLIKRGSIKENEISNYEGRRLTEKQEGPYIDLISNSNGQRHRRYITFGPFLDEPTRGNFDFFGLSKEATIPWF